MNLLHVATKEPVAPDEVLVGLDGETYTYAAHDEDFVYVLPKGARVRTDRFRPHFFRLERAS